MMAAAAVPLLALAGCSAEAEPEPEPLPEDPIAQMEIAFNDHPRKAVIREALDAAFAATDTPATSDNYSRAGSVLVTFREKYGIDEMDILECVPSRADDPRAPEKTFPNVAAVCLTDLAGG